LPSRSPNLNSHLERFFGSLKAECLHRMIFFGEKSLRRAVRPFLKHYHTERNHQGVANQILEAGYEVGRVDGKIGCRERVGGMLKYYYREAA
jgi:putative transposase